jgi:cytochrome c-type biogenesis protein CcmE
MKQSNSNKKRFAVGTLVVLAAFAFLIASGMKSNTLQAMPVSALRSADATSTSHIGQRLRVRGFVSPKPLQRVVDKEAPNGAGSTQYFEIVDKTQRLSVEYRDALPETFKPGSPVQVDGVYYAEGKFRADHVLTKCPSKYQAEEVKKAELAPTQSKPSHKTTSPRTS